MNRKEIKKLEKNNPLIKWLKSINCKYSGQNYYEFTKSRIKESFKKHYPNVKEKDFKKGIINITEFQADNKIQVSARKSTNNNPESKTRGENDE